MDKQTKVLYGNRTHKIDFKCLANYCPVTPKGRYRGFRKCAKCKYKGRKIHNPNCWIDLTNLPVNHKRRSVSIRFYEGDQYFEKLHKLILMDRPPKFIIQKLLDNVDLEKRTVDISKTLKDGGLS